MRRSPESGREEKMDRYSFQGEEETKIVGEEGGGKDKTEEDWIGDRFWGKEKGKKNQLLTHSRMLRRSSRGEGGGEEHGTGQHHY